MFENELCQIGLSKSEAQVYVELLRLGPQTVSVVANRAKINRSNTYAILRALQKRGFVSSFAKSNVLTFLANDPNCLVAYLDKKQRTYGYYRRQFLSLVPKFREISGIHGHSKPMVSYFEGVEGIKNLMNESLSAKTEICEYLPLHNWLEDPDLLKFSLSYSKRRIEQYNIKLRTIVPDSPDTRDYFDKFYNLSDGLTEIVFLPDKKFTKEFNNQVMMYDDKVLTIHFGADSDYGILIRNMEVSAMEKAIFEMLWKSLKSNE